MRIFIGCGGYSNEDWSLEGLIYEGVKKEDYLYAYAHHFNAVELNSSFYSIPSVKAFEGMNRKSQGSLQFTIKLNKVFTHDRLATPDDFVKMLENPSPLRKSGTMGAYLAQFPYSFNRNAHNRQYLLSLAQHFSDHNLAVEFRHQSWDIPEVRSSMEKYNLIWVSPDYPPLSGMPEPELYTTSPVGYIRLHGRNKSTWWEGETASERHDYLYSETELRDWAKKIASKSSELQELYVFFENTTKGHALKNAPMLRNELLQLGLTVTMPEDFKIQSGRLF